MSRASVDGRGSAGSFARGLLHVIIIERDAGPLSVPELDIQERCPLTGQQLSWLVNSSTYLWLLHMAWASQTMVVHFEREYPKSECPTRRPGGSCRASWQPEAPQHRFPCILPVKLSPDQLVFKGMGQWQVAQDIRGRPFLERTLGTASTPPH